MSWWTFSLTTTPPPTMHKCYAVEPRTEDDGEKHMNSQNIVNQTVQLIETELKD